MKIIYLILVAIITSCSYHLPNKSQERTILGTDIEVKPSGNSTVVTRYSDSTMTIVNLNAAGELLDSTTIYPIIDSIQK